MYVCMYSWRTIKEVNQLAFICFHSNFFIILIIIECIHLVNRTPFHSHIMIRFVPIAEQYLLHGICTSLIVCLAILWHCESIAGLNYLITDLISCDMSD